MVFKRRRLRQRVGENSPVAASSPADDDSVSPVAHVYTTLADLLRDQVGAQLESASSNNLEAVALLAANLAFILALMLLRATNPTYIAWWWWLPLPLFAASATFLVYPILPPSEKRRFQHGPHVPSLLLAISREPQTLEQIIGRLIKDLQTTWQNNDALLATERKFLRIGLYVLCIASVVGAGLYAWGLS
ncbi:MAG: hypothetical protein WAV54_01410 [Acidimicrobiales bacterium]